MTYHSILIVVTLALAHVSPKKNNCEINEILATAKNDRCYDQLMDNWFVKFQEMQNQGLSMEKADKEAAEFAVYEYKNCRSTF